MTPSRRTTLQWMMAAATLPLARWSPSAMAAPGGGTAPPLPFIVPWPDAIPEPLPAKGYGRDPDLTNPSVPWPLTFSKAQRSTIDILADMILPADELSPGAGTLGVGAFVDEWISAPYPTQRADRVKILGGLLWLDAQSNAMHAAPFAAIAQAQRDTLCDALTITPPPTRPSHSWMCYATSSFSASTVCRRAKPTWALSAISRLRAIIPDPLERRWTTFRICSAG